MRSSASAARVDVEPLERPSNAMAIECCSLFNGLSDEAKDRLVMESFMAYAERGESIWTAGSPSTFASVVASGFVKMTRGTSHGQEIVMELLGPGQCFGLFAAIEGRPFPLGSVAVTNCWYLKIPSRVLLPIYQSSEVLKDRIIRNISPRLRRAHEMMARLSSGRVEERIAAVLFILSDAFGIDAPSGLRLEVPLTRQDISEMAGTTVETTIRTLSRWQKRGILATERQFITVLKPQDLEDLLRARD